MPGFYFNVQIARREVTDLVGKDCASVAEARRAALMEAQDLISASLEPLQELSGWIEVEDKDHEPVFTFPLRSAAS